MILRKFWKNYSYAILLVIVTFIFSIISTSVFTKSHTGTLEKPDNLEQSEYAIEWTSSKSK